MEQRDVTYLNFAGENTAIQSSAEGSGCKNLTVTQSVSSPWKYTIETESTNKQ